MVINNKVCKNCASLEDNILALIIRKSPEKLDNPLKITLNRIVKNNIAGSLEMKPPDGSVFTMREVFLHVKKCDMTPVNFISWLLMST